MFARDVRATRNSGWICVFTSVQLCKDDYRSCADYNNSKSYRNLNFQGCPAWPYSSNPSWTQNHTSTIPGADLNDPNDVMNHEPMIEPEKVNFEHSVRRDPGGQYIQNRMQVYQTISSTVRSAECGRCRAFNDARVILAHLDKTHAYGFLVPSFETKPH